MSTTLPHGIIQINEGNIAWYGDITSNWQLIDSKIGIYDAAIATIPAPANTGTLTINYGGTTIAMFGADDAGNVSADIPAPGDGTLTVTQGGSSLGTFNANQAAAGTIDIPAPGNGTLTVAQGGSTLGSFTANQAANSVIAIPEPGAGVLTVTVDGITTGTFSANQATNETINISVPDVNDGTLTIQQNGATVDTFTANSSSDKTVNISVPTKTSDLNNDSGFITGVTWNDVSNKPAFATVATSGSYNDLSNKPTIPTVNNGTLTIQKNGTTVKTFTANASSNVTANITVPTKTSDLNNDSGFITGVAWNDVSNKPTFATVATSGSYNDLSNKPTIPTVNNATLTIQKNGTTVKTFTANASSNVTCNITVPTKTSELTNDSGFLTIADALPIGSYIQFAGSQAPAGFLVCNGGEISRTTYSALFAVIGTTYGSGDGSTTFNLPNLTDRFLQGSSTSGTVKNAGLPNITGYIYSPASSATEQQGTFKVNNLSSQVYSGGGDYFWRWSFDASRSSSIYGNSTTVQPPALTCLICIKY